MSVDASGPRREMVLRIVLARLISCGVSRGQVLKVDRLREGPLLDIALCSEWGPWSKGLSGGGDVSCCSADSAADGTTADAVRCSSSGRSALSACAALSPPARGIVAAAGGGCAAGCLLAVATGGSFAPVAREKCKEQYNTPLQTHARCDVFNMQDCHQNGKLAGNCH